MGRFIGIVGRNCSGKDTLAEVLEAKGFQHRSLSKIIRDEATARGMNQERKGLIALANKMREEEGPAVFAEKTKKVLGKGDWVLSSIRHPKEVEVLQSLPGFELWHITAPIELRHERANNRGRENALSLEAFKALESQEDQTSGEAVQRVGDVEAMAKITIRNEGSLEELQQQVEEFL